MAKYKDKYIRLGEKKKERKILTDELLIISHFGRCLLTVPSVLGKMLRSKFTSF